VGDKPAIVKGSNNNNNTTPCQHISILYKSRDKSEVGENALKSDKGSDSSENYGSVSEHSTANSIETYSYLSSAEESSSFNSSSTIDNIDEDGIYSLPLLITNLYAPPIRLYSNERIKPKPNSSHHHEGNFSTSFFNRRRSFNVADLIETKKRSGRLESNEKKNRIFSFLGRSETDDTTVNSANGQSNEKSTSWSNLKNKLIDKYFGGSESMNRQNKTDGNGSVLPVNNQYHTSGQKSSEIEDKRNKRTKANCTVELNFFIYQVDSLLLNELYLLWSRHALVSSEYRII